jgi:hypothetical protein
MFAMKMPWDATCCIPPCCVATQIVGPSLCGLWSTTPAGWIFVPTWPCPACVGNEEVLTMSPHEWHVSGPWTTLRLGIVQHDEFHSAEHAGGETVSMAITTVLSQWSTWRVSLRILQRLKTKNIRITVNLLGMSMRCNDIGQCLERKHYCTTIRLRYYPAATNDTTPRILRSYSGGSTSGFIT